MATSTTIHQTTNRRSARDNETRERISSMKKIILVGTALFFDILQMLAGLLDFLLPGLGAALSFVIWLFGMLTIWFIFRINGVGLIGEMIKSRTARKTNNKVAKAAIKQSARILAKISSTVADSFIGFWPGLTILTLFTIDQVRDNDRG